METLAQFYLAKGEYQQAREYFTRSLNKYYEIDTLNLPYYMPDIAGVHRELVFVYRELNQMDRSIEHEEKMVGLYRGLAKENPQKFLPQFADALNKYSWALYKHDLTRAIYFQEQAIQLYQQCMDSNFSYLPSNLAVSYARMARYQILNQKFDEAEKYARMCIKVENTKMNHKNLAHSVLYNGKFREAEKIYVELKDQFCDCAVPTPFKTLFLNDFDEFEAAGVTHPDVKKIRKELAN